MEVPSSELPCPVVITQTPYESRPHPGVAHLVDVELTLAPCQLSVAGGELPNEVVAAKEEAAEPGGPGDGCLNSS